VCREVVTLLDLAFHYGSEEDKRAADMLQRRLLHDDSKDCGVLNRIVGCMKEFKKHDKKIAKQERRETREYGVNMVMTMHVVLRVYERLSKSAFSVKKRTRYHTAPTGAAKVTCNANRVRQNKDKGEEEEDSEQEGDDQDGEAQGASKRGEHGPTEGKGAARDGDENQVRCTLSVLFAGATHLSSWRTALLAVTAHRLASRCAQWQLQKKRHLVGNSKILGLAHDVKMTYAGRRRQRQAGNALRRC
jgi:hypothetical protein